MGVLVADSIAGLGVPDEDGAKGLLRTDNVEEPLTWNLAHSVWLGKPQFTMRTADTIGGTMPGASTNWKYPGAFSESPKPEFNPVSQNFRIHKVLYAGELWAAGARLQEHLTAQMKQVADIGGGDSSIALAWYPLEEGEDFLSPSSFNHGVRVTLPSDEIDAVLSGIYRFCSSGWQNNVTTGDNVTLSEDVGVLYIPPTITEHLYPEIYQIGPSVSWRNFTALHRWCGGPGLGAGGSAEKPSKFPPADDVRGWYRSKHIAVAPGSTVAEWADFSGRFQALRQPTSTKRPTITVDSSLGGRQFVRFDGSNDSLSTAYPPIPLFQAEGGEMSPIDTLSDFTVYLVFRQRNAGGTQQAWLSKFGSGSSIFYRGDNTDQVNLWRGGSDFIYNRATPWSTPMPWTIWSVACDSSSVSVWENATSVGSGSSGSAGLLGLVLGATGTETLPAAIDVAELIVCIGTHGSTMRNAVVNYLNAEYAIF